MTVTSRQEHLLATTGDEFNDEDGSGVAYGFSSLHPGGVHFLLVDGSVRFISENVDSDRNPPYGLLQWLSTIQGGEVTGRFESAENREIHTRRVSASGRASRFKRQSARPTSGADLPSTTAIRGKLP